MTHASLFSGIGGPEVAAAMLGWENVFHCEINDFGRAILEYHFPKSKSYIDVTKTDFTEWQGRVDVLTGGFPCQPFSYAGRRGGAEDDRYLWPQFKRVIAEVRPAWVVGENVAGITTMVEPGEVTLMGSEASLFSEDDAVYRYRYDQPFTVERVCSDLEQLGYTVQPMLIPACAVGAPHRRDRVFIIANIENAMFGRQLHGQNDEQGGERNIGNIGTGSCERVCAEVSRIVATDTIGCGKGTPRESGSTEKDGRGTNSQQGERRAEAERNNGLHEFLRTTPDTEHLRLQHNLVRGSETRKLDKETIRGEIRLSEQVQLSKANGERGIASDTESNGSGRKSDSQDAAMPRQDRGQMAESDINGRIWGVSGSEAGGCEEIGQRWANFPTVSPVHRGNDGLPFPLGNLTIPFSRWRTESLKAYGNAIVPQVMYEIFRAIELTH